MKGSAKEIKRKGNGIPEKFNKKEEIVFDSRS